VNDNIICNTYLSLYQRSTEELDVLWSIVLPESDCWRVTAITERVSAQAR